MRPDDARVGALCSSGAAGSVRCGSNLGHADGAYGIGHALPLRDQDIHLAQLGDDLLRLVPLAGHRGPPSCPKTYLRMDHFSGGGSISRLSAEQLRALLELSHILRTGGAGP